MENLTKGGSRDQGRSRGKTALRPPGNEARWEGLDEPGEPGGDRGVEVWF